jgi:hypothetical protein
MTNVKPELESLFARMRAAWPSFAAEMAAYPHADALTLRDWSVLMLLAPGGRASREAVRNVVGDAADAVIGVLAGRGLIMEEYDEVRLAPKGEALLDDMVERRADLVSRVIDNAPEDDRERFLEAVRIMADAMDAHHRALVGA